MATPVLMPQLGNSVESCLIVQWLKQPGDSISEGDALCEIETDKSTMEVEAPASGTLIDVFYQADDDVPVKVAIAAIGDAGEDVSGLRPADAADAAPAAEAAPAAASTPAAAPVAAAPTPSGTAGGGAVSPRARNLAAEAGIDAGALAGSGPKGRVIERDVQAAIANGPTLSPAAKAAGGAAPAVGSGIGGRVLAADVVAAGGGQGGAAGEGPISSSAASSGWSREASLEQRVEIPVKGIRKVIAERMMASLGGTAQLTLNASANVAALQALRAKVKAQGEALGLPNITLNDMIIYACSRVLPQHPQVNAHFLGKTIQQFADVNIGVAVDTERGLMVPVVPQANRLTLAQICAVFKPMAKEAQAGSISPDKLQGGTFTITNLGALGISHFTPVLNAPEVAILGVGGIETKPVRAKDGSVAFEDHLALSLTIDHQAIDGAPAARFLAALVSALENFDLLLAQ